jgi:cbb3-type cytochrome oxidase subunit 3
MQNNFLSNLQNNAPTIATIFFILFFLQVVYSVFKKGQSKKFEDYAKIPFKDEEKNNIENTKNIENSTLKNSETLEQTNKLTKN